MNVISTQPRAVRACALLVALPFAALAGTNSWTGSGPEGGNIRDVEFDPTGGNVVFAMTPRGLYRSGNGGADWTLINEDIVDAPFAIDPTDSDVMYFASGDELLRSSDGGESATALANWPGATATGIDVGGDGVVYVSTGNDGVFRSGDAGASWTNPITGLPQSGGVPAPIDGVFVSPDDSDTVYVTLGSIDFGVYRTTNAGGQWQSRSIGLTSLTVSDLAIDPKAPATLYVATDDGVFFSVDSAGSWNAATTPIAFNGSDEASSVGVDTTAGSAIVYAGAPGGGFFKSPDAGVTWNLADTGFGTSTATAIAVSVASGSQLIAGTIAGLKRSTNGADNWVTANDGVVATNITALAADPVTAGTLYASANGIFKTTRSGSSWTSVTDGGAVAILIDPTNTQILYTASDGVQRSIDGGESYDPVLQNVTIDILAYSAEDGGIYAVDSKNGNLYHSADGLTFPLVGPIDSALALVVDSTDGEKVFIGTSDGASVSSNGGVSWSSIADLAGNSVTSLAQDPVDATVFYAATDAGVFRSDDGGAAWTAGATDEVVQIIVDPDAPEILYGTTSNGVLRSLDAGDSWHAIPANAPGDWTATQLALDGATNRVASRVYAGTTTRGVQSVDLAHDLQLAIAGPETDVGLETDFDYTTAVTNAGPGDAPRVTLEQTLPTSKATFVSATPDQGDCSFSDPVLTCDFGAVAEGATASVDVAMTATGQGVINSSASVTSFDKELAGSDNSATASATITQLFDLVATISGPTSTHPGDRVTYTAIARNDGPNTAGSVTFVTSVPAGGTFFNATTDANCTRDGGTLTCNLGALDPDESVDVEVSYDADDTGALVSTATVSAGNGTESDPSNDTAELTTQSSSSSDGGGGGGGALDPWMLLAMLALGGVRRRAVAASR
jgi:uncharacterized repeat protein (TIGR01451 family)